VSMKALEFVWEHSKQKGSELVVMLALADMANDNGQCYPGKSYLADKCRMTPRNLNYVLNKLVEAGEIRVIHRKREANDNQSNIYRIIGLDTDDQGFTPP